MGQACVPLRMPRQTRSTSNIVQQTPQMAPKPEDTVNSSNEYTQVVIITLHKPDTRNTSNRLLDLLNKQICIHPPLLDSQVHDSVSVCRDGFFYQVSTASVEEVLYSPNDFLDAGSHLSLALAYDVGSRESFDEMTRLWESTVHVATREQEQESALPLTVLVVAFRNGQDQGSANMDATEQDGEMFASRHGYLFAVCDTKTGQGTKEAFTRVAEDVHTATRVRFASDPGGLKLLKDQERTFCVVAVCACK